MTPDEPGDLVQLGETIVTTTANLRALRAQLAAGFLEALEKGLALPQAPPEPPPEGNRKARRAAVARARRGRL